MLKPTVTVDVIKRKPVVSHKTILTMPSVMAIDVGMGSKLEYFGGKPADSH